MTVKELIEKLKKCPENFEVTTEGCDCFGDVASIEVDEKQKAILLERSK